MTPENESFSNILTRSLKERNVAECINLVIIKVVKAHFRLEEQNNIVCFNSSSI